MKVLIADDERAHVFLLELFLRKWGYDEVLTVENGRDALAALQTDWSPCVAILDWNMPVLDGIEVTRRIKRGEHRHEIYILLVTAKTQEADRVVAAAAGVDYFMAKPYEPEVLRAAVHAGHQALEKNSIQS